MKAASDCGRDGGTRWRAVEAVAGEVDRLELVSGDMVDRLIRAAGARKAGHRRFDADRNFTIVGGQRLTLREGGDLVAVNGHSVRRANAALEKGHKA